MYTVKRIVETDPLVVNTVFMIEDMEELERYVEESVHRSVSKYASRHEVRHIRGGLLLHMEPLQDMSGLKVVLEYWQVPGAPHPTNSNAHVFKDPASCATLIRAYGEHEDTSKQVAERMGAIGKPVHKKAHQGLSLDYVVREIDGLTQRFVNDSNKASIKHIRQPVTYYKPKKAPLTYRGNFKGYKKWEI